MLSKVFDSKLALGSNVDIVLVAKNKEPAEKLINTLWRHIFEFEGRFSRFLPDSELSKFNKNAGLKTPLSREFLEILKAAKKLSHATGGLYNPFILPALQRSGYIKSRAEGYQNDPVDDYTDRGIPSSDKLLLAKDSAEIPFNSAIDLGGIGKGYLADQLSEMVEKHDFIHGYFISLGGDMVLSGSDENSQPWQVKVQSANNSDDELDFVLTAPRHKIAVATSGTLPRTGQKQNKSKHIIDPRTLKPAKTDIVLATVAAESATLCDVAASCIVILGSTLATNFAQEHNIDNYILQSKINNKVKVFAQGNLVHKQEVNYA